MHLNILIDAIETLLQLHKMPRAILCIHFIGICVSKSNQSL
jgi:hypothetical protein